MSLKSAKFKSPFHVIVGQIFVVKFPSLNPQVLDMDSKLSEFRQKLSAYPQPSVTPVTWMPEPSAVHFTPALGPSKCPSPEQHSTESPVSMTRR